MTVHHGEESKIVMRQALRSRTAEEMKDALPIELDGGQLKVVFSYEYKEQIQKAEIAIHGALFTTSQIEAERHKHSDEIDSERLKTRACISKIATLHDLSGGLEVAGVLKVLSSDAKQMATTLQGISLQISPDLDRAEYEAVSIPLGSNLDGAPIHMRRVLERLRTSYECHRLIAGQCYDKLSHLPGPSPIDFSEWVVSSIIDNPLPLNKNTTEVYELLNNHANVMENQATFLKKKFSDSCAISEIDQACWLNPASIAGVTRSV
jgi:hypothetical protein